MYATFICQAYFDKGGEKKSLAALKQKHGDFKAQENLDWYSSSAILQGKRKKMVSERLNSLLKVIWVTFCKLLHFLHSNIDLMNI